MKLTQRNVNQTNILSSKEALKSVNLFDLEDQKDRYEIKFPLDNAQNICYNTHKDACGG